MPELDGTLDPDSLTVFEVVLAAAVLVVAGLVARFLRRSIRARLSEAGDFPEGLGNSTRWMNIIKVREEFFREHAPQLCAENNPPTCDLLGVKCLARPEMVIEIACTAVF